MDGRDLAIALDFGVAAAYKAVMKPAEGTILTVSRLAAARAAGHAREDGSFEGVLEAAIQEGQEALTHTIDQNPVLKKAGVVDAGGQGLLLIYQGMKSVFDGQGIVPSTEVRPGTEGSIHPDTDAAGELELGELGEELIPILRAAETYRRETDGAFDITVAPVMSAWGFAAGSFRVPSQAELDGLLELVDGSAVGVEGRTVTLGPGQAIDLGGIAKGYAADKIVGVLREHDVPRANINLGGNVLAYDGRPDGTPWRVAIQDPARVGEQDGFAGVLALTDSFAVTSGGYQRYFEQDGKTYHHIIDPATGYPAENGLVSVTVEADAVEGAGAMCDALSTALFVMGEEQALEYWRSSGYEFELVLVTEDGRVLVTEGLADRFTAGEDTGYRYVTVS